MATSFPHFVPRLRARGVDAEYLPLGVRRPCGSLRPRASTRDGDRPRRRRLRRRDPRAGRPHGRHRAARAPRRASSTCRSGATSRTRCARARRSSARHHGEAWGLDMYRVLARTQVAVNRHGDIAEGYANNMRLFEATGVGALLLTESAATCRTCSSPAGRWWRTTTPDDLIEKVRHYLGARRRAPRASPPTGQAATLARAHLRHRIASSPRCSARAGGPMRVLVVDTYYPAFLDAHYRAARARRAPVRRAARRRCMDRRFGTATPTRASCARPATRRRGRRQLRRRSRRRWARETGAAGSPRLRARLPGRFGIRRARGCSPAIALAQAAAFEPDVVYCQDLSLLRAGGPRRAARRRAPRRRADRQRRRPDPSGCAATTSILTSFPHFVERFRALGIAQRVPAARLRRAAARPAPRRRTRPRGADVRRRRRPARPRGGTALLERLAARLPLEVWGYGADAARRPARRCASATAARRGGSTCTGVLAESRIVVNRHIDVAEGHANNMRLFEATGAGALLVTEAAPNLGELFEPGREVVDLRRRGRAGRPGRALPRHDDERARDRRGRPARARCRPHLHAARGASSPSSLERASDAEALADRDLAARVEVDTGRSRISRSRSRVVGDERQLAVLAARLAEAARRARRRPTVELGELAEHVARARRRRCCRRCCRPRARSPSRPPARVSAASDAPQ